MPPKRRTKKRVSGIEEEIREAAEAIPTIIRDSVAHEHTEAGRPEATRQKKQRILWTGVVSFSFIILVMWYWNTRTMIRGTLGGQDNAELTVLEHATANIREAIDLAALAEGPPDDADVAEEGRLTEEKAAEILHNALSTQVSSTISTGTEASSL